MGVNQELSLKVSWFNASSTRELWLGVLPAGCRHTVTEGGDVHSKQVETGLYAPVNKHRLKEPQSVPRSENTEVLLMQRESVTSC